MSQPGLRVGGSVVREVVRLAAAEVPGVMRVARHGPGWRAWLAGRPLETRIREGRVDVRIWLIARPAQPLTSLSDQIRQTIGSAVERVLGLQLGSLTVVVDGVGS